MLLKNFDKLNLLTSLTVQARRKWRVHRSRLLLPFQTLYSVKQSAIVTFKSVVLMGNQVRSCLRHRVDVLIPQST